MSNNLALKFLRVVNEAGLNGWGQVYARMPFGDEEMVNKGALFGAVFSKGENNPEKEAGILVWADEYYNSVERGGGLADFWEKFIAAYGDIEAVWAWVSLEEGKRVIKVVRKGGSGLTISREDKQVVLGEKNSEGRVIAGEIKAGDEVLIWAGGLEGKTGSLMRREINEEERIDEVAEQLIRDQIGAAGLLLKFEEERLRGNMDNADGLTEKITNTPNWQNDSYSVDVAEKAVETEVVSERLVGPITGKDRLVNWWKRISLRRGVMVGERRTDKKKRMAMGLGLLFLLILVVSVAWGSQKVKANREAEKWAEFSEPIEKKRFEAESLLGINQVGAKKLIEEARAAFDLRKGEFVNTKYKNKLNELEAGLNQSWQGISGEKEAGFDSEINLGLIRDNFKGDRLAWYKGDQFLTVDSNLGVVLSVETTQKEIKVIAGKGEGLGWGDIAPFGKTGFVLSRQGLGWMSSDVKMTSFDNAVSEPISLGVFSNYLYLLDGGNKEIFKYAISEGTVGERQRWLKQGEMIDLSATVDMAIDGDIWLVGGTAGLERFRRGVKENFTVNGVPEGAVFSRVAVEVDGEKGALLDRTHGWIVIFRKADGSFVSQLKSQRFKEASDIEFDGEGRLWMLVGGVMVEVK